MAFALQMYRCEELHRFLPANHKILPGPGEGALEREDANGVRDPPVL